eukprot:scaffold2380_cov380-Prasinococcus_capsulatus_cf.AAC.7
MCYLQHGPSWRTPCSRAMLVKQAATAPRDSIAQRGCCLHLAATARDGYLCFPAIPRRVPRAARRRGAYIHGRPPAHAAPTRSAFVAGARRCARRLPSPHVPPAASTHPLGWHASAPRARPEPPPRARCARRRDAAPPSQSYHHLCGCELGTYPRPGGESEKIRLKSGIVIGSRGEAWQPCQKRNGYPRERRPP